MSEIIASPAQERVTMEPVSLHLDKRRQLADRLRWIYEQRIISLDLAKEVCGKLQDIIHFLDAIPAPPQPGRDAVIEECAQAITSLRQSGAVIFDAKHSGQRGEDRSTALHDAINVVRTLTGEPK